MALPSPPPLFAVFRRELQLFEILRPVADSTVADSTVADSTVADKTAIKRLVYGAPAYVPVWTVARGLDHLSGTTHSFTIKDKQVDYTYTGAVLVAENHPQPIPIVHFSKTRYFPSALQGVRVIYSDGIQAAYFLRAAHWSRIIAKPVPVEEETADAVECDTELELEEEVKEEAPRYIIPPREPYQPEEMDPLKVGTCLSILFLFFLTAYLSSRKVEHSIVPDLDPYNPFENTCTVDNSTFFQDRFTVYYP